MIIFDKIPIGIYANSYNIKCLDNISNYQNFEFHVFGEDINIINNCIKRLIKNNVTIIFHPSFLLKKEDIEFYNKCRVTVFIDDYLIDTSSNMIISYLPKIKNLIINVTNNTFINELEEILNFYYDYNKYYCGILIDFNKIKNINELIKKLSKNIFLDIIKTYAYYTKYIELYNVIPSWTNFYINIKNKNLHIKVNEIPLSLEVNLYNIYETNFTPHKKCTKCIVSKFCGKENIITPCKNIQEFYKFIINLLLEDKL